MRKAAGLAALMLVSFWGCGSDTSPGAGVMVPVKGKVTYKGMPLTQGEVVFEPDGGREAYGRIQPDGTFELTTFKKGDGAVRGVHRVGVSGSLKGGKGAVPLKYKSPSSSKTEVEVADGKTEYAIDLK
jgi:hypothetical protein